MDFGTIKKNLEAHQYATPDEYNKDMEQVFTNARLYNDKASDVCRMADCLQVGTNQYVLSCQTMLMLEVEIWLILSSNTTTRG